MSKVLDTHTQPNLLYTFGIASRFMEQPTTLHFEVPKHILWYVKRTIDYRLNYRKGHEVEELVGFSDSDHGGDKVGEKSKSGLIFYLGIKTMTWKS